MCFLPVASCTAVWEPGDRASSSLHAPELLCTPGQVTPISGLQLPRLQQEGVGWDCCPPEARGPRGKCFPQAYRVSAARMTAIGEGTAEEGSIHVCSFELCRPPGDLVTSTGFRAQQTWADYLTILSLVSSSGRGITTQQCCEDEILHHVPGAMLRRLLCCLT